ncbi:hypothetical protein [Microbacterium sp. 3J1]|uniref:hypothetical protein n=1 Tax=Microbacterium sp. 3J1 TaxID=861269 RepID=UPI000A575E91|nr:hypothetical protein [Microbacterium sp. 3J1]
MTDDESPNPWAKIIGPCYTTTGLARTLGWTEAKVADAGETLQLLVLETGDGVTLYPAFQLHDGRVVDGLSDVLAVLQTGTAGHWTWAKWLNIALPDKDPPRAIDALRVGRLDEVLRDAEHDAWAWRS